MIGFSHHATLGAPGEQEREEKIVRDEAFAACRTGVALVSETGKSAAATARYKQESRGITESLEYNVLCFFRQLLVHTP
jgi:hypothetical protein